MSATELKLEEAMYFDFVTHHPSTAAVTDADSTPTAEVFEDATDTTVVALTVTKRTSKTGNYRVPVTAAAASGFEVGKTYNVVASATVNAIAGKGVIGRFKVRAQGKDDLADSVWDEATSGHTTAGTYGDKFGAHVAAVLKLVVGTGSTTTTVKFSTIDGSAPSATDDFYNGRVVVFTSGTLAGQAATITDYVGSSTTATVTTLTSAPANAVVGVVV